MARIFRPDVTVETLQKQSQRTLVEALGITFIEVGDDFLRGTIRVDHRNCQPMRILHGGASVALAETLASLAANSVSSLDLSKAYCVGQEINANHLRPAPEGTLVTGTARPFHIGAQSQVWGIELCNEKGQRTCVSRITMAVVRRPTP
jgi:1,4-dihydroxy-2-naphthoyl-CoA hydrolase